MPGGQVDNAGHETVVPENAPPAGGIVGLLIDGGKSVRPVNEMNISGNMKEFWTQLSEGKRPLPVVVDTDPESVFRGSELQRAVT